MLIENFLGRNRRSRPFCFTEKFLVTVGNWRSRSRGGHYAYREFFGYGLFGKVVFGWFSSYVGIGSWERSMRPNSWTFFWIEELFVSCTARGAYVDGRSHHSL